MKNIRKDPNFLFELRLGQGIIIWAFDGGTYSSGKFKIKTEVRQYSRVIFSRGHLCCGIPAVFGFSPDGLCAKELVLALVAMKPGDTDAEYFQDYSPEQLAWAEKWSDQINMIREYRYCDASGNPKKES